MARRRILPIALVAVLLVGGAACGDDGDGDADARDAGTTTTGAGGATASGDPSDPTASDPGGTTTEAGPTTSGPPFEGDAEPEVAEPDGTGTAQLVAVRVGQQRGATRFVLEFAGEVRPGYDVRWVDGPVTEDGSGDPVDIEGDAFLQVVVQPASGFDLEAGVPTYEGPTRLAAPDGGALTEAVRTGDFEAVLTWVLGAEERVPFTVSALGAPSRLVIDVEDS